MMNFSVKLNIYFNFMISIIEKTLAAYCFLFLPEGLPYLTLRTDDCRRKNVFRPDRNEINKGELWQKIQKVKKWA